jgi:hypothetical protein
MWKPVPTDSKSSSEEAITVFAVDTDGDWLLCALAPKAGINYVFASTGKRLTGQLYAPAKFDAFATVAGLLGANVTPIEAKGNAATVDLDFIGARFADLARIIGEVGRVNVIVAPGVVSTLNARVKDIPWDQALDLFVDRVGLAHTREGNVYFVVRRDTILAPTPKLPGTRMALDAKDATLAQIVTGVRALGKLELGSCSTTKVTVRLQHVAPGTIVKGLEVVSGEKLADKAECPSKPLTDEPIGELKLVAIISQGIKRVAVFDHMGTIVLGTPDGKRIKDIGDGYVACSTDAKDSTVLLRLEDGIGQRSGDDPVSDDDPVKSYRRTSALIQRGDAWIGILETPFGPRTADAASKPFERSIRFEVNYDGVHVMRDNVEVRMLPLWPP